MMRVVVLGIITLSFSFGSGFAGSNPFEVLIENAASPSETLEMLLTNKLPNGISNLTIQKPNHNSSVVGFDLAEVWRSVMNKPNSKVHVELRYDNGRITAATDGSSRSNILIDEMLKLVEGSILPGIAYRLVESPCISKECFQTLIDEVVDSPKIKQQFETIENRFGVLGYSLPEIMFATLEQMFLGTAHAIGIKAVAGLGELITLIYLYFTYPQNNIVDFQTALAAGCTIGTIVVGGIAWEVYKARSRSFGNSYRKF